MTISVDSKTHSPETLLYTYLVESFLGKRAALIVTTLISYGRSNIRELSKKSGLAQILVKKALVSLIQLNCVFIWEEESSRSGATFYSFNENGALLLLYSGEIISHIDQLYKDDGITQIVQNFMSLGNLTIGEYISSFGSSDAETTAKIEKHFTTLVSDKYLIPITKVHFNPLKDVWLRTYKKAYSQLPKSATVSELKRTAEAKGVAKLDLLKLLEYEPESLRIKDKQTSLLKINPNISLSFNLKRFLKARRSIQLTQLCSHRVGKITSIIYHHALLATEKNSPDVVNVLHNIGLTNEEINSSGNYEPKSSVLFNAKDVLKILPKDLELKDSVLKGPIKRKAQKSDSSSNKRIKTESGFSIPEKSNNESEDDDDGEGEIDDDFEADGLSALNIIDSHLKILLNSTTPFLRKSASGLYYVPFPDITVLLKRAIHDSVLSSTLGPPSARILRCVRENRLVSEKLINSVALLKEKEARSLTSNLVKYNFLQIQEVPKSADRAASKSVFLFRINEKHGNDFIKSNLCWNMGQILDKISSLKEENSTLISKINRDDVKGKELDYLLPSELAQLKTLNDKELDLTIKLNRLLSLWEPFKLFD